MTTNVITETGVAGTPVVTVKKPETREQAFERLATEFRSLTLNSVDSILKRAELVFDAKAKLGEGKKDTTNFNAFCQEVLGVNAGHSNAKKWHAIGASLRESDRFEDENVRKRLPDVWTTIYTITTLDDEQFETLINHADFSQKMTAAKLRDIVGLKNEATATTDLAIRCTVKAKELTAEQRKDIHDLIQAINKKYPAQFVVEGDLQKLVA
jgi:hypothetical protein